MSTDAFSTYPIPDLLHLWDRDKLTTEQAIGQLLQHLADLAKRLAEVERRLEQLAEAVNRKP
jgi:hypothetical protein